MKTSLAIAFLAVAMMLPGVASATVLTDVTATGDCDGWSLTVAVHWGASTYSADLDYLVQLTDLDGNVLEDVVFAGVITRPQGSPLDAVYVFTGTWQGGFQAPSFLLTGMVHLVTPTDDTMLEFSETLDCAVDSDDVSWSTLKANYR